eukprot:86508-Lingulodinium_polyedra.AAC.1
MDALDHLCATGLCSPARCRANARWRRGQATAKQRLANATPAAHHLLTGRRAVRDWLHGNPRRETVGGELPVP